MPITILPLSRCLRNVGSAFLLLFFILVILTSVEYIPCTKNRPGQWEMDKTPSRALALREFKGGRGQ